MLSMPTVSTISVPVNLATMVRDVLNVKVSRLQLSVHVNLATMVRDVLNVKVSRLQLFVH